MPAKQEVVGLWPRFYATIWLLCHCSREHIFVVQEATTSIFFAVVLQRANNFIVIRKRSEVFFTHRIARSDGDERIFTSYPKRR